MLKKNTTCIVCFALVLVFSLMLCVSAEDSNYVRFTRLSRMNSDGSFTFTFHYSCPSDKFVANESSIRIDTSAKIYHIANASNVYTDSSQKFRLTLYKDSFFGESEVGSYVGCANGVYGGKTFSGISVGSTYYFKIEPVEYDFDQTGYYFTGYGNVSNVTLK